MHRKLLNQYFKTDGWVTPTIGEKRVDNSNTPSYNKDIGATTYDLDDAWKSDHEKELRYAGDSARESVDKGLKETSKFMKDAPEGTNYSDVQSASVKWSLANDTNNKELKQSAFDELTGLLSTENKEEYLKKARPLQEFVDAKDTFDYNHNNYTTTKNAKQGFSATTYDLQQFLNSEGFGDKFGESLKEDGKMGAKTQYAYDQMLEAENNSTANTTEQPDKPAEPTSAQTYTQPVAPAQVDVPAPAQAVEPTQPAEAANPLKDALARHHESDIASRGGARGKSTANNTPNSDEYNKRVEENAKLNGKSVAKTEKSSKIISRNADAIKAAGKKYGVNPAIIAACIYSEQMLNYIILDPVLDKMYMFDPTVGIGQVSINTAKTIENYGRIEKIKKVGQKYEWHGNNSVKVDRWEVPGVGLVEGTYECALSKRLENEKQCVEFVAAYLQLIQDLWREAYPIIDGKSDILATLYNIGERGGEKGIHSNPESNEFGDFAKNNYYYMQYLLGIE